MYLFCSSEPIVIAAFTVSVRFCHKVYYRLVTRVMIRIFFKCYEKLTYMTLYIESVFRVKLVVLYLKIII